MNERKRSGKGKRPFGEPLREAYKSIEFDPVEDTGHPRSPRRFFKESYAATFHKEVEDQRIEVTQLPPFELSQGVHRHVNGLCIVTAGSRLPDRSTIAAIEFVATKAPVCSAAEKRKRQAKMLKGGKVEDTVTPTTVLANILLKSGDKLPIYSCVWGTILEVNSELSVDTLLDDPLLDGYLAIILPSGEFPPNKNRDRRNDDFDGDEVHPTGPEVKKTKTEKSVPAETAA
jgi:hypothetical protein